MVVVRTRTLRLLLRHPLVEAQQAGAQLTLQQYLPFVAALSCQRLAMYIVPAQPLQQQTGRLLGVVVLVQLGGGVVMT